MAIEIKYPPSGTQLPRQFVVMGKKLDAEKVIGVMIGLKPDNTTIDKDFFVGGNTLKVRKKNGNPDPLKWAIHFHMPKVPKSKQFILAVFDGQNLPIKIDTQNLTDDQKRDKLSIKKDNKKQNTKEAANITDSKAPVDPSRFPFIFGPFMDPPPGGEGARDYFVAYGLLPEDCNDIDLSKTTMADSLNSAQKIEPVWKYALDGFWSVVFDTIPTGVDYVDVKVAFLPEGEDESTDITVLG